ncbi:MAG: hypothetical protein NTW74_04315 [Acidobacteria bacterium]|nr:hypothetical protein [Acidobacteriota bacterium]
MQNQLGQFTAEQKLTALEAALQSNTFARSNQLKRLLTYLVKREIDGLAENPTEYEIAIEALGMPADFSPGEDSTVRNRVHSLRKKLEDLYRLELTESVIRIEFSRGTYLPRFLELTPLAESSPKLLLSESPTELEAPALTRKGPARLLPIATFATGVLLAGMAFLIFGYRFPVSRVDPILREVWGPILDPDANALICVATTPQMPIRSIPGQWKPLAGEPFLEAPPNVVEWYSKLRPQSTGNKIYLLPTTNSVGLGDAFGAASAAKLLTMAGASYQLVAERLVPLAAMRKRNVVLMGGASDTETVKQILTDRPFRLEFNPATGDYSIFEQKPGGRIFSAKRNSDNVLIETYGIVTVLPSEGSDGHQRMILVVGSYTAGVQGAMDFLNSPDSLRDFKNRIGGKIPSAYQIVVKTRIDKMLPLSSRYETHALMDLN